MKNESAAELLGIETKIPKVQGLKDDGSGCFAVFPPPNAPAGSIAMILQLKFDF